VEPASLKASPLLGIRFEKGHLSIRITGEAAVKLSSVLDKFDGLSFETPARSEART
jgi:hypothetical protein